jgi:hypothetical protein
MLGLYEVKNKNLEFNYRLFSSIYIKNGAPNIAVMIPTGI